MTMHIQNNRIVHILMQAVVLTWCSKWIPSSDPWHCNSKLHQKWN